ncbi:MAG: hypothetical protein ACRYHQ_13600 [Janthinobacterium lividum]
MLLSTTRAYPAFRFAGACFAAVAAIHWMAERALDWDNPIGLVVDDLAGHAFWILEALSGTSLIARRCSLHRAGSA